MYIFKILTLLVLTTLSACVSSVKDLVEEPQTYEQALLVKQIIDEKYRDVCTPPEKPEQFTNDDQITIWAYELINHDGCLIINGSSLSDNLNYMFAVRLIHQEYRNKQGY